MAFIYKTTNNINGKIYIGKSKVDDSEYLGSGLQITAAIKKYGKENFTKSLLEECRDCDANSREIFWIDQFGSTNTEIGYNISKGGSGGDHYWATLSIEEKMLHNKKISDSKLGRTRLPHSSETKKKQSNSFKEYAKNNPDFFKKRALAKCKKYVCVNHTTSTLYRTSNLKKFCIEHSLNFEAMRHNARTRKNFFDNTWSCSYSEFTSIIDTDIIHLLAEEVYNNNKAYKEKISQSRKRNK